VPCYSVKLSILDLEAWPSKLFFIHGENSFQFILPTSRNGLYPSLQKLNPAYLKGVRAVSKRRNVVAIPRDTRLVLWPPNITPGSLWWVMEHYIIHLLCRLRNNEVLKTNTWKLSHYILKLMYPERHIDQISVFVSSWLSSGSIMIQELINNLAPDGSVKDEMQRN
jgi:hypothetical protein